MYKDPKDSRLFFSKRQKRRRTKWRAKGLCVDCGKPPLNPGSRRCRKHATTENERRKERHHRKLKKGICPNCTNALEPGFKKCLSCLNKMRAKATSRNLVTARWRRALHLEVIQAYGGACECCGEKEPLFLEIDHIHGGGSAHRKTVKGGTGMYSWLKKQGFPKGEYRLLCGNCNYGRFRNKGTCPHQERR